MFILRLRCYHILLAQAAHSCTISQRTGRFFLPSVVCVRIFGTLDQLFGDSLRSSMKSIANRLAANFAA